MHVLLSNDDGVEATGIEHLAARLGKVAEVTVIAPDRDRSGASNSLTLDMPIRIRRLGNGFIGVNGTPTDCVHLAITGLMSEQPDMVISGINDGANLGDDVLYSGTVAAAMEGRFLGFPAFAVSLVGGEGKITHFDSASEAVVRLLEMMQSDPLPADSILNINVPDRPWSEIHGFRVARLGHRHRAEQVVKDQDPRGRTIYWVGAPGGEQDAGPGTDFSAVREGYISVTPLQVDLTRHTALEGLENWFRRGRSS